MKPSYALMPPCKSQIWGYWRWVTSQTKQTVKRRIPNFFFFASGFKNSKTVSCTDYSCIAVREWLSYMPTLPDYPWVSRIRHRSPALPYRPPYLPDKIIFWAFLCLGLKFSPFLAQNVNLFAVRFLGHVFSHWQRLFLVWKRLLRFWIVCTSCQTSFNVLSHSHRGLGLFVGGGGGGGVKKRVSRF